MRCRSPVSFDDRTIATSTALIGPDDFDVVVGREGTSTAILSGVPTDR